MDLALTNEERAAAIRRFWEGGNLPLKYNTRNLFRPETHDRAIILREYISSCRSVFARRTIQTLPDDILFNIFNEAVRRSHDNTQLNEWGHGEPIFSTPVTLSHVSRRFRRAALSCRNLWVHVNNDMFEDQLSAYLHRSGSAGLIVALNLKVVKDDRL
ncbi:hypothetical protein DFH11DRAFT_189512 [Phellopilus nigrolimitatus]|nr:hypothetical protein DFH11DRAFT_189512 [Phellopilus nigrolimitatus]